MSGSSHVGPVPRSSTDQERLTARRSVSPRLALMEHLNLLEGEVPGAAAYQAAKRLLANGNTSPETVARLGGRRGEESVDHAAAMRLWSPDGGKGIPPWDMVDAFLDSYADRTGDGGERPLVERLYAEAEKAAADRGGAPETFPASTSAEAIAVAERYGYGAFVETVALDSPSRGLGTAVGFAVVPAFFGVLLLFLANGNVLALVSGVVLCALAAGILTLGIVGLRRPAPARPRLFLFTNGIVVGIDGVLDAYTWEDLELVDKAVDSHTGVDYRPVAVKILLIGPLGRSTQFAIPSVRRETVMELARTGGATIR